MFRSLIAVSLLALAAPAAVNAQASMNCPEYNPGTFSCTAPEVEVYLSFTWTAPQAIGTLQLNSATGAVADFICSPLQPTRQPGGYYTQTVRTGYIEVDIVNYYEYPPGGYTASARVTCKSPTPSEAGLPGLIQAGDPPPAPAEDPDHDIWWFLRLFGSYGWGWNVGSDATCYTNAGCGEESPYNDQQ